MSAVLATTGLSVRFGGVRAVDEVDVVVEEGQLVGLIGPNGAGKTTFIDAITGFVRSTGRVELDGHDLAGLPPHARAQRGLARTWQSTELFDDLTVRENLTVAAQRPSFLALAAELVGKRVGQSAAAERRARAARPRPDRGGDAGGADPGPAKARRGRPGDRDGAAAPLPGRARGRARHEREQGSRTAAPADRRRGHDDAPDRPRHGARDDDLRPDHRAGVRQGDRGRVAGRGAARPARRDRVPRGRRDRGGGRRRRRADQPEAGTP